MRPGCGNGMSAFELSALIERERGEHIREIGRLTAERDAAIAERDRAWVTAERLTAESTQRLADRNAALAQVAAYRTAAETLGKVARDNRVRGPAAATPELIHGVSQECGDAWCACHP